MVSSLVVSLPLRLLSDAATTKLQVVDDTGIILFVQFFFNLYVVLPLITYAEMDPAEHSINGVISSTPVHECSYFSDFNALKLSLVEVEKTFCHPQSIVQSATSPVPNTIDDAIHISSDTGTLSPIKMTDVTPQNIAQCSSPTNISDSPALPTSNDWKTNVALTLNDKEELISGQWLSDKCINAALHLLKSQFPSQNGLQDTLILEKYKKYSSSSNKHSKSLGIVLQTSSHQMAV